MKPAKPKLRSVLLDASFVNALLATDDPQHEAARRLYAILVDRYEHGLDRLFALSPVIGDVPREFRRNALAPVIMVRVARQHRSAAGKIAGAPPDVALSLVMMRRERIGTVATATHDFDNVDVDVLVASAADVSTADIGTTDGRGVEGAVTASASEPSVDRADTAQAVSSGTAPLPAPRSTDE